MSSSQQSSRREFLRHSLSATAAAGVAPYILSSRGWSAESAEPPSDRIRIGAIGLGSRGRDIGRTLSNYGPIVAMCDIDSDHRFDYQNMLVRSGVGVAHGYKDYREVLDRKDVDAVVIATPDHWHVKIAVEAILAGKDVYCEKPLTLTIDEGRQMIRVLDKSDCVMQVGTQQRSEKQFIQAIALVRAGRIGDVKKVTIGIDRAPYSEAIPTAGVPRSLDWDMWLGQCAMREYRFGGGVKKWTAKKSIGDGSENASNCHEEFRWWYDFSGGKLTDWGAHHMDICHWLLGQHEPGGGPKKVTPVHVEHPVEFDEHGNPKQTDRYSVATKYEFRLDFPNEVEVTVSSDARNGLLIEGTKGRFFVNRGTIEGKPLEDLKDNPLPEDALDQVRGVGRPWDHMGDFIHCIKTREKPVANVWSHHRSVTTCHLMAIAGRLNRAIEWDAANETVVGDDVSNAMQKREQRKGYEILEA
jgi:predicted dehydrogenase